MNTEQRENLVRTLTTAEAGSRAFEQAKAVLAQGAAEGLITRVEKLEQTISKASEGSDLLARRVFWLNVAIAAATLVAAAATAVQAYVALNSGGK